MPIVGVSQLAPAAAPSQAGPFWVEYFCPRQSPYWQRRRTPLATIGQAIAEAQVIKPPAGAARVLDRNGRQVYAA